MQYYYTKVQMNVYGGSKVKESLVVIDVTVSRLTQTYHCSIATETTGR